MRAEPRVGLPAKRSLKIAPCEKHIDVADQIFAKIPNIKFLQNSFNGSRPVMPCVRIDSNYKGGPRACE